METYEITLTVKATVQAFTLGDAIDAIQDTFGVGSDGGLTVTEMKVTHVEPLSEPE